MKNIRLIKIGINTLNPGNTKRTLPDGENYWIFLQSLTPMMISTKDGMATTNKNDCILYKPQTPRFIGAPKEDTPFKNNWMFFQCDEFEEVCSRYQIPLNQVIKDRNPQEISTCFFNLAKELVQTPIFSERVMELILESILIHFSREIHIQSAFTKNDLVYAKEFERLREEIYTDPAREWNLDSMAKHLAVSTAWLCVLYRRLFHTTPKQDVLAARIEIAKFSLAYTDEPIGGIALSAGFQNEFYFSRAFKRATGSPPHEYRKSFEMSISTIHKE